MESNSYSLSDIAAVSGRNNGGLFGGGDWYWVILLFVLVAFGWGGFGGGFGNMGGGGAAQNYVLASDFATIQRQLSDGFNGIDNALDRQNAGICDLGYTQLSLSNQTNMAMMQGFNAVQSQLADCCCKTQSGIERVNTNMAMNTNVLSRDIERGFCDTNYNSQSQHYQTMNAIDKVGDRIIDWMSQRDSQALRDENQALRLAASQAAQNQYLVNTLRPCPTPAYITCNPWASQSPYGSCGGFGACA